MNKETKVLSKTEQFKAHLQRIIQIRTGVKVSKQVAWDLFKDLHNGTVQFVLNQEEDDKGNRTLSLAGVGKFQVKASEPRGVKAGMVKNEAGEEVRDESLPVWPFVPRYKFYPSSKTGAAIENFFGLGDSEEKLGNYGIFVEEVAEEKSTKKETKKETTEEVAVEDIDFSDEI